MIAIGFGGSGKTTFINKCFKDLESKRVYLINLDPAVKELDYKPNMDIRDTINYIETMNKFGLGPNGAISTCLSIFATKMNQLIDILETKKDYYDYILVDVPGQIEVFTWSASGEMIMKSLKTLGIPIEIQYIIDTKKCCKYKSFISSVLYASNVFYKLNTPMKLVFNKAEDEKTIEIVESFIKNNGEFDGQVNCETNSDDFYKDILMDIHTNLVDSLFTMVDHTFVSCL